MPAGNLRLVWDADRDRPQLVRPDMVRVEEGAPSGLPSRLAKNVSVAGITQPEARRMAEDFIRGADRHIELLRDPENSHDPNAIKVVGTWRDRLSGDLRTGQLGWVPAALAAEIALHLPADARIGAALQVMFPPGRESSPGIRFDIWQRRGGPKLSLS